MGYNAAGVMGVNIVSGDEAENRLGLSSAWFWMTYKGVVTTDEESL